MSLIGERNVLLHVYQLLLVFDQNYFFFSSSTPKTLSDYTVSSFVNDYVFFKVQCFRFRLPLKELVGRQSITCLTADQ